MNIIQKESKQKISMKKKWAYNIIMLLIPVILLLFLEMMLRLFHYGDDLSLFHKSENYPGYYELNKKVANRFFSKLDATAPSNDIFLINKPDTSFRIFVMGCSTARGFPYQMGTTFSRILYYRLQDAFPGKRIEIVNTSMTAVNSYTQVDFIDEILEMYPDAILIYTGHNEFYGALGVGSVENGGNVRWIKRLHLFLIKFRTYQMMKNTINNIQKAFITKSHRQQGTLMEQIVKDKSIGYRSKVYIAGIEQFRKNMTIVVEKVKKAGVPLIFSDVVSNIHGNKPFKSMETEGFPSADSAFSKARQLEREGRFDEARQAYYLAKDYDGIRFRAPEDLNAVIHGICTSANIPVLEMKKFFEQNSPNGLIGDNLMTEHLHPNIDGYFLMADAFLNEMQKNRFISSNWDTTRIMPTAFYRNNWGFTALDSLCADFKIKSLKAGWPFKPDSVINQFMATYTPVSTIDSMAFMCAKYSNVFLEDKHIELAKIYKSKGQYLNAYKEYYSLIKNYPYLYDSYSEATICLDLLGDYKTAIDLMLTFPDRYSNYYACARIGHFYQKADQPLKAIQYYEQARKIHKKEDKFEYMLSALYEMYIQTNNKIKADELLSKIRIIQPGLNPGNVTKKNTVDDSNNIVKALNEKAGKLVEEKKIDEALALLLKSLTIKESTYANQLIGTILLHKKDPKSIEYLEKAYYGDPKDVNTLNNLFVAHLMQKNYSMAGRFLNELKLVSSDQVRIQKLQLLLDKAKNDQLK